MVDISRHALELASALEEAEETTLGPTDSELCAMALRAYAASKQDHPCARRRLWSSPMRAALAALILAVAPIAAIASFADFDGDGAVTPVDAHLALNMLFHGTKAAERRVEIDGEVLRAVIGPSTNPHVDLAIVSLRNH